MRRETALVIGFLVIVVGTVGVLWSFALPNLRPVHVPRIVSAQMNVGSTREARTLSAVQLEALNHWFGDHAAGWGPLGSTPPSTGDAVLTLHPERGPDIAMSVWIGVSGADWNDTVVMQLAPQKPFRFQAFSDDGFAALRKIVQPEQLDMSGAP